ncbi:hypothetical protein [Taibaiella koreensis]|uniref:hypothetical protein n=1 Tax=Taibaiella koreensis TaxID=1268548 RepID=UPI000E59E293|nr:hypothetical protein [Taibaiella koreensis]
MKRLFFLFLLTGLTTGWAQAQTDTNRAKDTNRVADSNIATQQDTSLAEDGEAGGISDTADDTGNNDSQRFPWLPVVLGLVAGAVITAVVMRLSSGKAKANTPRPESQPETQPIREEGRPSPQEQKLKRQLDNLTKEKEQLQQQLASDRNFDNEYYGEAFRKLVAPMHDAMERGAHREIEENLMKIMSHYSSLTRYKIAKKQPYDEANIQYLMSRKSPGEGLATEINKDTPVDKIPKHIKPLLDLLREQGSGGLDESIISGYRIRNI